MNEDFYIGYEPDMPSRLARRIVCIVASLLVLAATVAGTLAAAQMKSSPARFEYGNTRLFEGWLIEEPYPALEVLADDGQPLWYWLVGGGKHGAASLVKGLEGRRVRMSGTLIERDDDVMIEVIPSSITPLSSPARAVPPSRTIGRRVVEGEIVDSKCHLGVMKPGEGPTHRDCAVRCLLGGIPPMLVVRHGLDVARVPLVGPDQEDLSAWRPLTGRPVRVRGTLLVRAGQRFLAVSAADIEGVVSSGPARRLGTLFLRRVPLAHE